MDCEWKKKKSFQRGKKREKRSWKAKNLDFDTPKIFLQLFHNKIIPVLTAAPTDYFSSSHIEVIVSFQKMTSNWINSKLGPTLCAGPCACEQQMSVMPQNGPIGADLSEIHAVSIYQRL